MVAERSETERVWPGRYARANVEIWKYVNRVAVAYLGVRDEAGLGVFFMGLPLLPTAGSGPRGFNTGPTASLPAGPTTDRLFPTEDGTAGRGTHADARPDPAT